MTDNPLMHREIEVKFVKQGIHCYPAAATDPALATGDMYDVSFLGNPHFHYFYFEVRVQVFKNDRDIEFIQFQRWCEHQYSSGVLALNSQSCEMMAESLIELIHARYPGRQIRVAVYEDNINGAILTRKVD